MSNEDKHTSGHHAGCCGGKNHGQHEGCCGGKHNHIADNRPADEASEGTEAKSCGCKGAGGKDDAADASRAKIPLPKVDFSTFVLSIASTALLQLGEVPNPENGKLEMDLILAKHSIDVLDMIKEKICTGLNEDESRLLDGVLYELHMKYVIKSK